jgi:hypothetical protein
MLNSSYQGLTRRMLNYAVFEKFINSKEKFATISITSAEMASSNLKLIIFY